MIRLFLSSITLFCLIFSSPAAHALDQSASMFTLVSDGWEGNLTEKMVMVQEQNRAAGIRTSVQLQEDQVRGQERARVVGKMLKDMEFRKFSNSFSATAEDILHNNPGARVPASVIGMGAKIWMGQSLTVVKSDEFNVRTYLGARDRSGSLEFVSPKWNGKLSYERGTGMNLGIGRDLSMIKSRAAVLYNLQSRTLSTQLVRTLLPNFALCLTATQPQLATTQTDARLVYELIF